MASPMPLPPPVMMATCPSKRPGRNMLGMASGTLAREGRGNPAAAKEG